MSPSYENFPPPEEPEKREVEREVVETIEAASEKVEQRSAREIAAEIVVQASDKGREKYTPSVTELLEGEGVNEEMRNEVEEAVYEMLGTSREEVEYARSQLEERHLTCVAIPSQNGGQMVRVGYDFGRQEVHVYLRKETAEDVRRIMIMNWMQTASHDPWGAVLDRQGNDLALEPLAGRDDWPDSGDRQAYDEKLDKEVEAVLSLAGSKEKMVLSFAVDAYPEEVRAELYDRLATRLLGSDWQRQIDEAERELEARVEELHARLYGSRWKETSLKEARSREEVDTRYNMATSLLTNEPGVQFRIIRNNFYKDRERFPYIQQLVGENYKGI